MSTIWSVDLKGGLVQEQVGDLVRDHEALAGTKEAMRFL
jgi:hypothetical protein